MDVDWLLSGQNVTEMCGSELNSLAVNNFSCSLMTPQQTVDMRFEYLRTV